MAESNKKTNFSETSSIIKNTVSEMKNKNKKIFKLSVALALVFVVIVCAMAIISNDTVKSSIVNVFIPNKLEISEITFYSERNEDYKADESEHSVFDMFKCYYYPGNDNSKDKVYLADDGIYSTEDESRNIGLAFVLGGLANMSLLFQILKIIAVVIVILLVVLAIYMWYRADEKRYKEAQEKIKKIKNRSH